jgi:hypothetical protein
LKVGTNDLPSVVKKNVVVAVVSVSSMKAFPTVGLALQLSSGWLARGGGGQYPLEGGGGQYPPRGSSGHVGGCPAVGDPPHDIMSGRPI